MMHQQQAANSLRLASKMFHRHHTQLPHQMGRKQLIAFHGVPANQEHQMIYIRFEKLENSKSWIRIQIDKWYNAALA